MTARTTAKTALITGISGQDGSYLAELLLAKGYQVHGIVRRASYPNLDRIAHLLDRIHLHTADMADALSLDAVVRTVKPTHVYNLAAQSQVWTSFEIPEYTLQVTAGGTIRLLESCRRHVPGVRFYQASTSEQFGSVPPPQNESTPFHPCSPYGAAKIFAHHAAVNYREAYGMFICCGLLFNHESERRGEGFVTRKITRAAGRIKHGLQDRVRLGNLKAQRDWGHAQDYVRAMWLMLEQNRPTDYVVGTGITHTVQEFAKAAFEEAGLEWVKYVTLDSALKRPSEVDVLRADSMKAGALLGWKPEIDFATLVKRMVAHDLELARAEKETQLYIGSSQVTRQDGCVSLNTLNEARKSDPVPAT
jgi:GDPmannose 4,6-dehydratase